MSELFGDADLAKVEQQIDAWLADLRTQNAAIVALDRSYESGVRWFVRMRGEAKDFTTVWLKLGQRTLSYETYVMPAPQESTDSVYESLLRRNNKLVGTLYFTVEQCFKSLRRIGFASRFDSRLIE